MALLENKVIKVIKDAQETDIQLYSDPADITQDDDYAIFPIVGTDGTTMMYAQAVRADIESLPDTVQRTPLYYYPAEGIISVYQLLNAAVPPITLWAVVIFQGEGQTIHCYTPSEAEFRAGRGEDHTTSFLLEDGGTYEAKAVIDPEYASTYIPGDITITDGGQPINKTINLIITDQPSDVELSVSPGSVTATYTGTREEAIHSASFDVSSLEQLSTTVNIDLVITSTDGSDFEGTFDIKRGITPYSVPINMGKASSTGEDSVIVSGQSISSTNGSYSVNMSLNLGGMIEGGSMLYFDFTNTKKKTANNIKLNITLEDVTESGYDSSKYELYPVITGTYVDDDVAKESGITIVEDIKYKLTDPNYVLNDDVDRFELVNIIAGDEYTQQLLDDKIINIIEMQILGTEYPISQLLGASFISIDVYPHQETIDHISLIYQWASKKTVKLVNIHYDLENSSIIFTDGNVIDVLPVKISGTEDVSIDMPADNSPVEFTPGPFTLEFDDTAETPVTGTHWNLTRWNNIMPGEISCGIIDGDRIISPCTNEKASDGKVVINAAQITFTKSGDYTYKLDIDANLIGLLTYDPSIITINCSDEQVFMHPSGYQLPFTLTFASGSEDNKLTIDADTYPTSFTLTFAFAMDSSVPFPEEYADSYDGWLIRDLADGEYTFTLVNENGDDRKIATNTADGLVQFGPIELDHPMNITYTIEFIMSQDITDYMAPKEPEPPHP